MNKNVNEFFRNLISTKTEEINDNVIQIRFFGCGGSGRTRDSGGTLSCKHHHNGAPGVP